MIASRFMFATLLAASSVTACVDLDDNQLDATTSALSSSSWTTVFVGARPVSYPPAMTMLDGVEYYVYADQSFTPGTHDLSWHQCDGTSCTTTKPISGQKSMGRVSLAAFNGYIYMVHQGDSDERAVWFSRLDVTTGRWTTNVQLPFETVGGSPALAVFNNRLYMVGSREKDVTHNGVTIATYPLWYSSMTADEVWAPSATISSQSESAPSLAVLGNTLYLAHRNGTAAEIVLQKMPLGGGWSAPSYITAGPSNSYIQGDDVQLAAVNGYLHLVHHRLSGGYTYWTYNRGCDAFAPEISVDAYSSASESMSTGINGLLLNRVNYYWAVNRFIAPPPPETAPQCGAI